MVIERVRELLAEQLGMNVADIKPESRIIDDIGADSLDIVEMLMTVEQEWGLIIDDEDMLKFTTVQSVADYIAEKTK